VAHGGGQLLLAHERNRVDRDPLPTDVVPVGLGDGAHGDESDLGAAAHHDDALAVDAREVRGLFDRADALYPAHVFDDGLERRFVERELEVDVGGRLARVVDVDVGDVGPVVGQDPRQSGQNAGAVRDFGEQCVGGHERL
jgi:hypothetical protein